MPTVNLLTWNIQNFGPTKSGVYYNNYDIARAIAKEVVDTGADLFCMVELNTTNNATAAQVAGILLDELHDYANDLGRNEWNTCVLSPNTGREFYAFFVRDTAFTIPMPITGAQGVGGVPDVLGNGFPAITAGEFTGNTAAGVLNQHFPLLVPDLMRYSYGGGRPLGIPNWPAVRLPVLGLFWVPTAAAGSRLLPIWACHFAANVPQASSQISTMRYFSLLWSLNPAGAPPVQLRVDPNAGGAMTVTATNEYVVTGDFNIDYLQQGWLYSALDQNGPRWLDASGWVNDTTHLVTYANYTRRMTTTSDLAVNAYDNFFTRVNAATASPVTPANPVVYDVPEDVRTRRLRLKASVQHYAELDQRGFQGSNQYQDFVTDYARQIAGDPSHLITVKGTLVGGRLISDHLPIALQITL
jgi:hypothetical protein